LRRQGGTRSAVPRHWFLRDQGCEEIELLRKELLVLAEIVSEQRERLRKRTSSENNLGSSARNSVERRETLEDPNRVVRAQDGDGRAEANATRTTGDPREHDFRRRYRKVAAVMFANADKVYAQPVGKHRLFNDIPYYLGMRQQLPGRIGRDVAECIQAEFEMLRHIVLPSPFVDEKFRHLPAGEADDRAAGYALGAMK
jgi:hypothetical protein